MRTSFPRISRHNFLDLPRCDGRRRARRRGAALVEFAMIAILFFTMLLGMIQFGLYQSTTNTLWNLSREGARFASVSQPSTAAIVAHVKAVAPPNISSDKMVITVSPDTRTSGQEVKVTIIYDLADKIIFPLVGGFLRRPDPETKEPSYRYATSTTMRVE